MSVRASERRRLYLALMGMLSVAVAAGVLGTRSSPPALTANGARVGVSALPPAPRSDARTTVVTQPRQGRSPRVLITPAGRALIGPIPDEQGHIEAEIPELEEALAAEGLDSKWTQDVLAAARASLPETADVSEMQVACSQTMCRIKLVKPEETQAGWSDIDQALSPVVRGEKMFLTESEDGVATGFLYFSAEDSVLPFGAESDDEDES